MKFDFSNNQGETLAGRLELPEGAVRAYALFAHCFTCSKDIVAASVISRSLAKKGIGVLRFDFTGLGNSHGDFANTNFSSNVEDLLSAYKSLFEKYEKPKILIGHSLGGAAVLRAAQLLKDVTAVVTLCAPSDVSHVSHLFEPSISKIKEEGHAEVSLVGRKFKIKKQFLEDISEANILEGLKQLKKALLVLHSPLDTTVSVDHAANIFLAAKHPKSFISLDDADHLLMKKEDGAYAASVISAWVEKYL